MREWLDVATLVKVKSTQGRFAARMAANLPVLFYEGLEVHFVPPQLDAPRYAIVSSVRGGSGASVELQFEGVDQESAERLVGCHCMVKRSLVQNREETDLEDFGGWKVLDEAGWAIGTVVSLISNSMQDLLEVELVGTQKRALVPFVDAFIVSMDPSKKVITMSLPAGLLEL